jgi:hypothetical protein
MELSAIIYQALGEMACIYYLFMGFDIHECRSRKQAAIVPAYSCLSTGTYSNLLYTVDSDAKGTSKFSKPGWKENDHTRRSQQEHS